MRLVIPRDELSSLNIFFNEDSIFFNEDSVTKGTMTLAKETLVKMKAILFI
ncbi:MAG: hypothetical protein WCC17_03370 [Candidatus Nitrosopolaris sp.]